MSASEDHQPICIKSAIRRAQAYALDAHGAQMHGDRPYIAHLVEVAEVMLYAGISDPDMAMAAFLHDVVEDTRRTIGEIEDQFGQRVADLVWAVTGVGENRAIRNLSMYRKITKVPGAPTLKACDRIANMEFSARSGSVRHAQMYLGEFNTFRTHVAASIPDVLLDRLDHAALDLKKLQQ